MDEDDESIQMVIKEEAPIKLRKPRKIVIPRREPSIVVPPHVRHYPSPDKSTCATCGCFPKEEPYDKHKKMNPCQKSPLSLYELAAAEVERLPTPPPLQWGVEDVVRWCEEDLALPQYRECFLDNQIDGNRLLMLEDPSKCPMINIHDFEHIKRIVHSVRSLYGMDYIRFARSVGLPPRRPLVHCTWYHSRTGPSWGTRQNWTRADILRWMKVLAPAPVYRDHWELVWYQRPQFPSVRIARVDKPQAPLLPGRVEVEPPPVCGEYLVPRKFKLLVNIPEKDQMIWVQRRHSEKSEKKRGKEEEQKTKEGKAKRKEGAKRKKKGEFQFTIAADSHLLKAPVSQEGKRGDQLVLARRQMNRDKFLAF